MDQKFTNFEQVDRYLKGNLSETERAAFETKMQKDPLLQSEIKFQKEVFQAIGETRKTNIKARLDRLSVDHSPWTISSPFKVAAIVSVLFFTSVGTYLVLTLPSNDVFTPVDIAASSDVSQEEGLAERPPEPNVISENTPDVTVVEPNESTLTADANSVATQQPVSPELPTIRRPVVAAEFSDDTVQLDYSDFEIPQKQGLQTKDAGESSISVERVASNTYPFHYQFYDEKLFLHGDFVEEPYKIIALNTEAGRNLFLKYAQKYYFLEKQLEISPLILIQDTVLIKQLIQLSATD